MQVGPENGEVMQKFKHEDEVRVVRGQYTGETGTIFGDPIEVPAVLPAPGNDDQEIAGEERLGYFYRVDLEGEDDTVQLMEADLGAV